MRNQGKKQTVAGVELVVVAPRRARAGEGSWKREWKVTSPGASYCIKGGSAGLGGCGTGFEVMMPSYGNSLLEIVLGKFKTLKGALEFIAGRKE